MTRGRTVVAVATALLLPVLLGGAADGAADVGRPDDLDSYVRQLAADDDLPGLAVRVTTPTRSSTWLRGHDGSGRPVDADTPFLLGSVSKSFTATAVLSLAEDGDIALGAPVDRYLRWFPHPEVTVRDLLRHTSGYDAAAGLAHADLFDNHAGALERAARAAAGEPRPSRPGSFSYSDANYLFLGALAEEVTGRSFGAVLHRRVLDPLGLDHTAVTDDEAGQLGLAAGHRSWWGVQRRFDPPFDTSGVPYGYVASTLDDLSGYLDAQADGVILTDRSRAAMQSAQVTTGTGADGADHWYGYGWRGGSLEDGLEYREHSGATPGFFAHLLWLPDDDVRVVVLTNTYAEAQAPVLAEAARNLARLAVGRPPRGASPDLTLAAAPFVGAAAALAGLGTLLALALRSRGVPSSRRRPRVGRRVVGSVGAAVLGVGLWVLPGQLGYSHRTLALWAPDLEWSLRAGALVWAVVAVWSAVTWRRGAPRP